MKLNALAIIISVIHTVLHAEPRNALVIGCDYKGSSLELPSPMHDAKAVAAKLPEVGFSKDSVILVQNPSRQQFIAAVDSFGAKLKSTGGVGVFYFSGHGAQVDGENYLIPSAANVKFREHLKTEGLAASYISTTMEGAKNGVNILILDACRSNDLPTAKGKGAFKKGFAQMDGDGILFCFAAKDGQEALDTGKGSVYTNALLQNMASPGIGIMEMLTNVRKEVKQLTEGKQEPFIYSGLDRNFAFLPGTQPKSNEAAALAAKLAESERKLAEAQKAHSAQMPDKQKPNGSTKFTSQYMDANFVSLNRLKSGEVEITLDLLAKPDAGLEYDVQMSQRENKVDTPADIVWTKAETSITSNSGDVLTPVGGTGLTVLNSKLRFNHPANMPNRQPLRIRLRYAPRAGSFSAKQTFDFNGKLNVLYCDASYHVPMGAFAVNVHFEDLELGGSVQPTRSSESPSSTTPKKK